MGDLLGPMALPSVLHHVDLKLADVDRGIDQALAFKVARHPSETMERLWLRVLALAWQWREGIAFGPGLCEPDAPDVVAALPDGRAALVVRVGKPDPERVANAPLSALRASRKNPCASANFTKSSRSSSVSGCSKRSLKARQTAAASRRPSSCISKKCSSSPISK